MRHAEYIHFVQYKLRRSIGWFNIQAFDYAQADIKIAFDIIVRKEEGLELYCIT